MIPCKKVLFLSLVIGMASSASGQAFLKLSGEVIDEQTKQPLQYASVSLMTRQIGTISNEDGRFDLFIPSEFSTDTVIVSFLGYSPHKVAAKALAASSNYLIRLKTKTLILDEVVVRQSKLTGSEIITKAFHDLEINYPSQPYIYSGFVRELWSENKKAVSLVETVVDIYDDGYRKLGIKSVKVREKVNVKFSRASDNYMDDAFTPFMERFNALTSALRWNQVKYPHPDVIGDLKNKEVSLEGVVSSNERVLYVVSFISENPSNKLFERKDTYYIDHETFAIKRIEWREYSKNGKYRSEAWSLDSEHSYQAKDVVTVYEFEEYKGKMYLRYFHEHGEADIKNTISNVIEHEIEGDVIFVVTDVNENGHSRVINDNMDHRKSLRLQTTPYDEDFWNNYEQVKLVPLTAKQVIDLETNKSLTQQFIQSGSGVRATHRKK